MQQYIVHPWRLRWNIVNTFLGGKIGGRIVSMQKTHSLYFQLLKKSC